MQRYSMADSPKILTSWKEIGAYLGKGVRTVQRWERELALPVRRPENGKHVVVAVSDDLDHWIAQLKSRAISGACCDCKALLEAAHARIADLLDENARLHRRLATNSSADQAVPVAVPDRSGRRQSRSA
jgi:hypothetical protein